MQARIFGGPVLIAAEEARSRAGRKHAETAARADAPGARPRPAFLSRHACVRKRVLSVHGFPAGYKDSMGLFLLPPAYSAESGVLPENTGGNEHCRGIVLKLDRAGFKGFECPVV
jgi:hypothetical protein